MQDQINIDVCIGVHYLENRALGLLLRVIFLCPKNSVKLTYVKYIFILTRFSSLKNNSSKWNFANFVYVVLTSFSKCEIQFVKR